MTWWRNHLPAAAVGAISAAVVLLLLAMHTDLRAAAPNVPACVLPALARHAVARRPWEKALAMVALDCHVDEEAADDVWSAHQHAEEIEGIVPMPLERR